MPLSTTVSNSNTRLNRDQKEQFFRDGFIVIRNAVSPAAAQEARELIAATLPNDKRRLLAPPNLATHPSIISLFRDSCLADLVRNEMGPFPDVISSQVAVTPAGDDLGGRPGPHVDGNWSGPFPKDGKDIDKVRGRPLDAARWFGENDNVRGNNDGQLWIDPQRRLSLGCYTALVGIAVNDQLIPGAGQLGVIRGVHSEVEAWFRQQRDSGDVIGPEGKGWPRIAVDENGRTYLNGLPDTVKAAAAQRAAEAKSIEGWPWPELTPVLLGAGDAVIALHSCPHTPTPNYSENARMNVYFRIRRWRDGNPHEGSRRVGHGVSDHPDRGYYGQFLDYPDDYDPWQTSIDRMCDHWSEWDGMQELVGARDSTAT